MALFQLRGVGLPNVYLLNGFRITHEDGEEATAYEDLDGLYFAITRQICISNAPLTPQELKFLRKRLGIGQEQLGQLVDKTSQAVAKWEKGLASIGVGDALAIRLAWLAEYSPRDAITVAKQLKTRSNVPVSSYCFEFDSEWKCAGAGQDHLAIDTLTDSAIGSIKVMAMSAVSSYEMTRATVMEVEEERTEWTTT